MSKDKFVCYGTYQTIFKCLIKCPFKKECEIQTMNDKTFKNIMKDLDENESTENNEG